MNSVINRVIVVWFVLTARAALSVSTVHAEEERVLLAEHETIAVLESVQYTLCRGLTALCPDRCGDSGEVATFTIVKYTRFVKHGEYGDRQTSFHVQVSDYDRKPLEDSTFAESIQVLKAGDPVRLWWNHDYVTKDGASYPERPIQKLEKIEGEELDNLLQQQAAAAVDVENKIEIDLAQLDTNGLRGVGKGKVAMSYEFKIPNERRDEVLAIDSTLQLSRDSRGRVGAGEDETLCIGSTHQENFRAVLQELASLPYVERIIECHFE